jgi:rSAM/selenodomain-associated transferase 2
VLVSVIIPTLNEEDGIQSCIAAARRDYAPSQVEVVVVDGGSTDQTRSRVPPGVAVVESPRGRGIQMSRGASYAKGDVLLFCHADTHLPEGWRAPVVDALAKPGVSGGTFQRRYEPERGLILWFLNRVRSWGLWWALHGERCQFMTRSTFEAIGGYPDTILMEDLEMSRALHRRGRIAVLPVRVVTSSRRLLENGVLRQGLLVQWYCFRYLVLGASAEDIARAYQSSREAVVDSGRQCGPKDAPGRL